MLGISKFVAKVRIIWELANFRSASRTGDYGRAGRNVKAGRNVSHPKNGLQLFCQFNLCFSFSKLSIVSKNSFITSV